MNLFVFVLLNARHGQGVMAFVSGDIYEGQWSNDKMNGFGTLKRSSLGTRSLGVRGLLSRRNFSTSFYLSF